MECTIWGNNAATFKSKNGDKIKLFNCKTGMRDGLPKILTDTNTILSECKKN